MAAARGAAFPPLTTTAFPCATEISHRSDPTSCRLPFGKITGIPYPKGREGVKENGLRVRRELWRRKPVTYRLLRRPEMEKPQSCLCKTRGSPPPAPHSEGRWWPRPRRAHRPSLGSAAATSGRQPSAFPSGRLAPREQRSQLTGVSFPLPSLRSMKIVRNSAKKTFNSINASRQVKPGPAAEAEKRERTRRPHSSGPPLPSAGRSWNGRPGPAAGAPRAGA